MVAAMLIGPLGRHEARLHLGSLGVVILPMVTLNESYFIIPDPVAV